MSNITFNVINTDTDVTHIQPAVRKEESTGGVGYAFSFVAAAHTGDIPLNFNMVKQSTVSGIVVTLTDGANAQDFTMNKGSGAGNHSVSAALQKALNLKAVGDTSILKFFYKGTTLGATDGLLRLSSDDSSINTVTLYQGTGAGGTFVNRETIVYVTATAITPGSEAVVLNSYNLVNQ